MGKHWHNRPAGSNWGEFGDDDQIGRLNLLTAERVKRAVEEVREGKVFCLSLPLDYPGGSRLNPNRSPPRLRPVICQGQPMRNFRDAEVVAGAIDTSNDDVMVLYSQYSTQWDSLAHVGQIFDADSDGVPELVYYNGFRAGEHIEAYESQEPASVDALVPAGVHALSIDRMAEAGVQGRGVLVDLHRHFGRDRVLVDYEALMRVLDADGVEIEAADMLCLHTGFAALLLEMDRDPDAETMRTSCAVLDGRDSKLLNWISDSGISVLIADNYAVEDMPARVPPRPVFGCRSTSIACSISVFTSASCGT